MATAATAQRRGRRAGLTIGALSDGRTSTAAVGTASVVGSRLLIGSVGSVTLGPLS